MKYCRSVMLTEVLLSMRFKVEYPDDYIRKTRSIIAAAKLTHIYKDGDEFVVKAGENTYVLPVFEGAINLAAEHILGDGPLDSLEFTPDAEGTWRPNMCSLRKELDEAGRRRKK